MLKSLSDDLKVLSEPGNLALYPKSEQGCSMVALRWPSIVSLPELRAKQGTASYIQQVPND